MFPVVLSMFLFALVGAISPGPVNLIAASIGASAGFLRAIPHVAGASVSYTAIVWLAGSGLNRLLITYPQSAEVLQYLGAAYLLYLSVKIGLAKPVTDVRRPQRLSAGIMQGVWSQSLNPKAWLVAVSGVSLFVGAGQTAPVLLLVFCSISGVVCFLSVATWAALGKLIGKWLAKATYQVMFNRLMALLLMLAVVSMLKSV